MGRLKSFDPHPYFDLYFDPCLVGDPKSFFWPAPIAFSLGDLVAGAAAGATHLQSLVVLASFIGWGELSISDICAKSKIREKQTCTNLIATILRHVLPPMSWWGKQWIHTKDCVTKWQDLLERKGVFRYWRQLIPLRERGWEGNTK